ncbi:hypothetical protein CC78DRAFT_32985 [Lojkania enalia]|uniref:Uncharacterized protein n=1 Tax=Lojkania enalia TaxID=147567 RepID=A0A9P4N934_9PLEO|nr:hypothetical protein CC78DRAFT_32985 [Didymosphaeria enalia]
MEAAVIGYATPKDWQDAMRNNSRYKMHEIIERLGLKANWSSNKRGKTNFDSPLVKQLVADMGDVVAGLPKEHHELHAHLSAPGSLRTEVEDLLKKHGSEIWGRTGPREHLVKAGSADVEPLFYPKDLYFENEEDRSLIRVLLHWWLGQKAFNVILARDRMARERKRKEMFRKARANGQGPHDTASPLDVSQIPGILSNEPPRHAQILQLDTGVGSRPMSAASLTPPASSESPIVQPRPSISASTNGFTAINAKIHRQEDAFARPVSVPRQSTSRQVAAELENLVSNFLWDMGTAAKGHEYRTASPATPQFAPGEASRNGTAHRGLDIDTLRAFRRYIYPNQDGPECEEELLLRRLETAWRDTVRSCHKANYGNTTLFAARDRAFLTWIELKRHLAELERVDKCTYRALCLTSRSRNLLSRADGY